MIIQSLYIYPIKGIKGVSILEASVEKNGLAHDRRYMLADLEGQFISQRNHPVLTQMAPIRQDGLWSISFEGDRVEIEDNTFSEKQYEVEVWGDRFLANEVSVEISKWFSSRLDFPCRLMAMPHKEARIKEFAKAPYNTSLSFADGYPILTLGTASLDQLNAALDSPIAEDRFRPNIYIQTAKAHAEDEWKDFRIGNEVICRNIKPCVRCQVITIDQDTGVKGQEPTRTLATYRKFDNGICFGSNVIVMDEGTIKVGDTIELIN